MIFLADGRVDGLASKGVTQPELQKKSAKKDKVKRPKELPARDRGSEAPPLIVCYIGKETEPSIQFDA